MCRVTYERACSATGAVDPTVAKENDMASAHAYEIVARPARAQAVRPTAFRRTAGVRRATLVLTIIAGVLATQATAGGRSRVVVVVPTPGGTDVPIAPHEKVGAVTVLDLPGGGQVAVVRIDPMPAKPDFNIITPNGVSHPFTNGPTGVPGETVRWVSQPIHHPDGSTSYEVYGEYTGPGYSGRGATQKFPPGSRCIPDPPQPPGLTMTCPDAIAAEPAVEAEVLARLGMPDNPGSEVWWIPSGEFWFSDDLSPEPEVVWIGSTSKPLRVSASEQQPAGVVGAVIPKSSPVWVDRLDSYVVGSGLHGRGGWAGWDGDPTFDAFVSDIQAHTIPNSMEVAGDTDLVREYEGYASAKWVFAAAQYIPSDFESGGDDQFAGSYLVMLNRYDDSGVHDAPDWSVQMQFDSNDGMLKVYYGDGLNTVDVPYVPDRWVPIEVVIDLDTDWTQVYYDGALVTEYSWTGGVLGEGGGAFDIAAVDFYANGSSPIYYDTLKLAPARR